MYSESAAPVNKAQTIVGHAGSISYLMVNNRICRPRDVQACKPFGFVRLVVRNRLHDREVFLKPLIRRPICHDEVANEAIINPDY